MTISNVSLITRLDQSQNTNSENSSLVTKESIILSDTDQDHMQSDFSILEISSNIELDNIGIVEVAQYISTQNRVNNELDNSGIIVNVSSLNQELENTEMNIENLSLHSEILFLEPLFSDMPSVSHKFTRKILDILIFFLITVIAMMLFLIIILGDVIKNSSDTCVYYIDNVVVDDACFTDDDTTADSKIDYTNLQNFLNFLKFFVQSTKFITLRSHVELDRWGRPGVWYEDLYDFSEWKQFTKRRKKTPVETKNEIFTYFELPSFPHDKKKIRGSKRRQIWKDAMVSPSETNLSVNKSDLNPKASQFNGHFKRSDSRDCSKTLGELRVQNVGNVVIAHLNINSVRNKFDNLVELINDNIDILVIGETKLDESFPANQFRINGFKKPYRKDRNANGGGVMVYVREDIPSQKLKDNLPSNVEAILVEINLRKSKFLLTPPMRTMVFLMLLFCKN